MTKKTKIVGNSNRGANPSSAHYLSPSKPYTGDGKTRRRFIDGVIQVVFRKADGSKQ